eukprot:TRINITY_DN6209_c0_g1_i2.p1 TRINITY_DN6209_c0_g1~~TRINITY_DN6209_c0_g1_i2.p1  ORF type:complete len:143 (-),score=4.94 TRINITY_DN6209_c0_g1_i2:44-472(-)
MYWTDGKKASSNRKKVPSTSRLKPGCYVLFPSGCKKHAKFGGRNKWTRDKWGERHRNAARNKRQCMVVRRNNFQTWCGIKDHKMYWTVGKKGSRNRRKVPSTSRLKPGCYVLFSIRMQEACEIWWKEQMDPRQSGGKKEECC